MAQQLGMQFELTAREQAFVREFIDRYSWKFAATMSRIPHEYVVRHGFASRRQLLQGCGVPDEPFERFVRILREKGVVQKRGSRKFTYLYVDGHKYWTMGNPIEETTIINRATVDV